MLCRVKVLRFCFCRCFHLSVLLAFHRLRGSLVHKQSKALRARFHGLCGGGNTKWSCLALPASKKPHHFKFQSIFHSPPFFSRFCRSIASTQEHCPTVPHPHFSFCFFKTGTVTSRGSSAVGKDSANANSHVRIPPERQAFSRTSENQFVEEYEEEQD